MKAIALTVYAAEVDRQKAIQAEFQGFITQSVDQRSERGNY